MVAAAITNNPRAVVTLQRLRMSIIVSWIFSAIPAALQMWCVYRAWQLYHEAPLAGYHSEACAQLRHWLCGYALLPFFLPCFALALYVFIVWWVFFMGSLLQA